MATTTTATARLNLSRRPRRLRRTEAIRTLVRETRLSADTFVYPLFVTHGRGVRDEISSMPGQYQLSLDQLAGEAQELKSLGVPAVLLFGLPASKDDRGSEAYAADGIVQEAVRMRVPVIPVAIIGPDDQAPILYDVKTIARWLRLPAFPITPTFPWLGPLGLLPYPVRYRIVYGEPLALYEQAPPEAADDRARMDEMAARVRLTVQHLVDRNR